MSNVPDNVKKPADKKAKKAEAEQDAAFSFEHEGDTYTLKPTWEVLTPGWLRANRRRDEIDSFFTMIETLAPDDDGKTLEVIDNMDRDEFQKLMKNFYEFIGGGPGN